MEEALAVAADWASRALFAHPLPWAVAAAVSL